MEPGETSIGRRNPADDHSSHKIPPRKKGRATYAAPPLTTVRFTADLRPDTSIGALAHYSE